MHWNLSNRESPPPMAAETPEFFRETVWYLVSCSDVRFCTSHCARRSQMYSWLCRRDQNKSTESSKTDLDEVLALGIGLEERPAVDILQANLLSQLLNHLSGCNRRQRREGKG
jgi:hypothetical protein